ncbi:MAG: 6-phosphogluconolactonase [Bacteriovorax sp.]|nr:6-phosphogluconolactonase [Bacteriovorax sp.]
MLVRYPNEEALAIAAAKIFIEQFHKAINRSGRFNVLLSGGATPRRTYEYLAEEPFKDQVDWSRVDFFWGDERCVDSNDPLSNYLMVNEALLSHIAIPANQIHPILCSQNPHKSAILYENTLRKYFSHSKPSFDLVFLGLGVDGHIASLFPQASALKERERWFIAVQKETEDFARITVTLPILNLAQLIVFLVTNEEKSKILEKVLSQEEPSTTLPARLIQPINGKLFWLVDASVFTNFVS